MKAWVISNAFGLDQLRQIERPTPTPEFGQVVVRIRAAALNYRDLLLARGHYDPRQRLPYVPLSDGAGEVVRVGPGVSRVQVGDRVCSLFAQDWWGGAPQRRHLAGTLGGPRDGVLAEEVLLSAEGVVPFPEHLSFEEAATLPCAALTAWSALFGERPVRPGESVLVLGTGGVSLFALSFAVAAGARVLITSRSEEKLARALKLGASDLIRTSDGTGFADTVRQLVPEGVDHVIEVGGAGTLPESLRVVRPGGRVALIGVLAGRTAELDLAPIFMRQVTVQGVLVGHRESFETMNRSVAFHRLKPAIDRLFDFSEARVAFDHLERGTHFGKIVIRGA